MDNDKRYLNIPVPMLKELHTNSKAFFNNAFDVGIYLYSQTLEGDEDKQYKDALKFLGITERNIDAAIKNAQSIISILPAKYPKTGIEKEMLFNYYRNDKSEFEIICLAAFLGIKSILGKKPYDKTNKKMIHARMFGFKSIQDLPIQLTPVQKKYQIRWQMDKVLNELQLNWNLKVLCDHNRGFYVSFDLSLDNLAGVVQKDKQKYRLAQLKEQKRKALESAKAKLTAS